MKNQEVPPRFSSAVVAACVFLSAVAVLHVIRPSAVPTCPGSER